MISAIYKIRDRGQVVNEACQWIGDNMKLALHLIFYPTLIVGLALVLNLLFFDNSVVYILFGLFVVLIIPVQVNLMFHVVENPDEFDYPNKMPRIRQLMSHWWQYYLPFLKMFVFGIFAILISSMTFVGAIAVEMALPLVIVIAQRDEDAGINSVAIAFKYIFQSLGNFLMCYIGNMIIMYSLIFSPFVVWFGLSRFLQLFVSKSLYTWMNHLFGADTFLSIACGFAVFGAVLGFHINNVVYHFFYGHAKEKQEHLALVEGIEKFEDL